MNAKKMYLNVLFIFTAITFVFGQNPKREVVFTLNSNEKLFGNEYYLLQIFNQYRFACVTEDTLTRKNTFVFNGERIKEINPNALSSFNVAKDNGYIFTYEENSKWYINYNGVVDGGFEDIFVRDGSYTTAGSVLKTLEKNYDYLYKLAGLWYVHKDGKDKKIDFFIEKYTDHNDIKDYININGSISGPYDWDFTYLSLTENGKYAYSYRTNESEYYVNINACNCMDGPYDMVWGVELSENGKYAYSYQKNDKWYVNINGSTKGPFDNGMGGTDVILTKSGKYAYQYFKDDNLYVNINGNINGPYDGYKFSDLTLTESGKYAFRCGSGIWWDIYINGNKKGTYLYYDNQQPEVVLTEGGQYAYTYYKYDDNGQNGKSYININGDIKGPYYYSYGITLTEDGQYAYHYFENGNLYVNNNGNVTPDPIITNAVYDLFYYGTGTSDEIELNTKNNEYTFHSSNKYGYIVINGRPYGKAYALQAWYDEKRNAFIWTAAEGRELVRYEYKLIK